MWRWWRRPHTAHRTDDPSPSRCTLKDLPGLSARDGRVRCSCAARVRLVGKGRCRVQATGHCAQCTAFSKRIGRTRHRSHRSLRCLSQQMQGASPMGHCTQRRALPSRAAPAHADEGPGAPLALWERGACLGTRVRPEWTAATLAAPTLRVRFGGAVGGPSPSSR